MYQRKRSPGSPYFGEAWERNSEIAEYHRRGRTIEALATEYRLSPGRIRAIILAQWRKAPKEYIPNGKANPA